MNYDAETEADRAEIELLVRLRDECGGDGGAPAVERAVLDALDRRIAVLTGRWNAMLASIPALEELDRAIETAAIRHAAAAGAFDSCAADAIHDEWPATVLVGATLTAVLRGMTIFPDSALGLATVLGTGLVVVNHAVRLWEVLSVASTWLRARRDHTAVRARHHRTMADIEAGRAADSITR